MAIDVRLTNAQALRVCELIGKVEAADFRTLEKLGLDGNDIRPLRNAAARILVALMDEIPERFEEPVARGLINVLMEQVKQGDHAHNA